MVGAAGSDDECRHHSFGMARFKAVEGSQKERCDHEEPGIGAGVLSEVERIHRLYEARAA